MQLDKETYLDYGQPRAKKKFPSSIDHARQTSVGFLVDR